MCVCVVCVEMLDSVMAIISAQARKSWSSNTRSQIPEMCPESKDQHIRVGGQMSRSSNSSTCTRAAPEHKDKSELAIGMEMIRPLTTQPSKVPRSCYATMAKSRSKTGCCMLALRSRSATCRVVGQRLCVLKPANSGDCRKSVVKIIVRCRH